MGCMDPIHSLYFFPEYSAAEVPLGHYARAHNNTGLVILRGCLCWVSYMGMSCCAYITNRISVIIVDWYFFWARAHPKLSQLLTDLDWCDNRTHALVMVFDSPWSYLIENLHIHEGRRFKSLMSMEVEFVPWCLNQKT